MLEPPGETESGSAGTQPDKGYPSSGAPMTSLAPDGFGRQGPFSEIPLDIGAHASENRALCKVLVFSGFKSRPATGRSSR